MNAEKQRVAIAEACGWREIKASNVAWGHPEGFHPTEATGRRRLPDYLNSLDAMHEAEKVLTPLGKEDLYLQFLGVINFEEGTKLFKWGMATATAAQRAEAFLRCLSLWNDNA